MSVKSKRCLAEAGCPHGICNSIAKILSQKFNRKGGMIWMRSPLVRIHCDPIAETAIPPFPSCKGIQNQKISKKGEKQ